MRSDVNNPDSSINHGPVVDVHAHSIPLDNRRLEGIAAVNCVDD